MKLEVYESPASTGDSRTSTELFYRKVDVDSEFMRQSYIRCMRNMELATTKVGYYRCCYLNASREGSERYKRFVAAKERWEKWFLFWKRTAEKYKSN